MSTRSEHQPGSATPADGPGLRFADRMASIGTVGSFDVAAKARQLEQDGHHVIHFEIGEPDFPTPENIVEAGVSAMRAGATRYTPPSGVAAAREAAAAYVGRRAGVPVGPENIVFVPGSKNIVYFTLLALVNPGDEVIVPDPGYPSYRALVEFTGATRVDLPLRPENGFRPDPGELRSLVTPRTKLLILNFPANPTGAVLTRADAEELADVIIGNDLIVLVDEINARLTFDGEHISLYGLEGMAGRTVILDGLSKAWSMCGWRLGFGAMPTGLAVRMDKLMVQTSACTATFSQAAAIEAFTAPESDRAVQAMVAEFRRRRDIVVPRLNSMAGVRCHSPAGAFYAFPDIRGTGWNERVLAVHLLSEANVALLPGTGFGSQGAGHLRLSFATSVQDITTGLDRIGDFLSHASQPA